MRHRFLLLLVALFSVTSLAAQSAPLPASEILDMAFRQAAREHKRVFVIFHASWCGWCRKMDASMNDPVCKNFFDDNFVVTHLIVYESSDKKALENPGAEALLEKYQDSSKGIPFWLVYDEKGNYLADSRIRKDDDLSGEPGNNTGCPATPEEVHYLLQVLKRVTPLTNDQLAIIAKRFRENDSSQ